MMQGDLLIKEDFKLLSVHKARHLMKKYVSNPVLLEKLVACYEPDTLSGFQLKDILSTNHEFGALRDAVEEKISETKTIDPTKALSIFLLPEEDKKKKKEETE